MNATAARGLAAIGAVLAIVGIFLDAILSTSYWDFDGTFAWTGLVLGGARAAAGRRGYARIRAGRLAVRDRGGPGRVLGLVPRRDRVRRLGPDPGRHVAVPCAGRPDRRRRRCPRLPHGRRARRPEASRCRRWSRGSGSCSYSPGDLPRRERRRAATGTARAGIPLGILMLVLAIAAARCWAGSDRRRTDAGRSTWRSRSSCSGSSPSTRSARRSTASASVRPAPGSRSPAGSSPPAGRGRPAAAEMPRTAAAPAQP